MEKKDDGEAQPTVVSNLTTNCLSFSSITHKSRAEKQRKDDSQQRKEFPNQRWCSFSFSMFYWIIHLSYCFDDLMTSISRSNAKKTKLCVLASVDKKTSSIMIMVTKISIAKDKSLINFIVLLMVTIGKSCDCDVTTRWSRCTHKMCKINLRF